MKISQQIKHLRTSQGLSQESFAERIGVERNTVSMWERDKQTPSKKHIEDVEKAFGLPQGFFIIEQKVAPSVDAEKARFFISKKVIYFLLSIVFLTALCVSIALWGQKTFWDLQSYLGESLCVKTVVLACCTIFSAFVSAIGIFCCIIGLAVYKRQKKSQ